jgi:hypothetical protein
MGGNLFSPRRDLPELTKFGVIMATPTPERLFGIQGFIKFDSAKPESPSISAAHGANVAMYPKLPELLLVVIQQGVEGSASEMGIKTDLLYHLRKRHLLEWSADIASRNSTVAYRYRMRNSMKWLISMCK